MSAHVLITNAILYVFIPLWLLAGFGDWLFHRRTGISHNAGLKEAVLHQLMLAEVGLPLLAGLFLEINALLLALMIAGFLLHEATVLWDLRYASSRRTIAPGEQIVHSYQELLPLILLTLVAVLHWDQFRALLTLSGEARFVFEWKRDPLPAAYVWTVIVAGVLLIGIPYTEELWRCWRDRHGVPPLDTAQ
ncbi:diguanylate cyclase [Noviherbaspirillum aridicola]|uniref:Diguanylate cyclase n=1 Tax=Noviherbaspirillum aridicola TaxID=2849687 RepID=A0ABQ4Q6T8_9BURK|nr:diguanylate cyclase [Noviherbaspirillum aridicola]GIZ52751.1 hypothetical protein NCCP691_27650 [Noviherbaspirillum aridicola]